MDKFKYLKKGASVSVVLALLNRYHDLPVVRVVDVQNVVEVPGIRIKSLDNISLIVIVKRIHEISFVAV